MVWVVGGERRVDPINAAPLLDAAGAIVGAVKVALDITPRKRLEAELAASEARFRTIAEKSPVMIWRTDVDGRCDYVNQAWSDFRGRGLERGAGDGWTEGIHPDDRDRVLATVRDAIGPPRAVRADLPHAPQGRPVPLDRRPRHPLPRRPRDVPRLPRLVPRHHRADRAGGGAGAAARRRRGGVAAQDPARLGAVARRQDAAQRRRPGGAAAGDPLRRRPGPRGPGVPAHDPPLGPQRARPARRPAQPQQDRRRGARPPEVVAVPARAVPGRVPGEHRAAGPDEGAGRPPRARPAGRGRAWRPTARSSSRSSANLLSNALRYTERGHIRIFGEKAADQIRIAVEDTGVGIDPDDQPRIFDEFAVLDNPKRAEGEGTGLGLAICRRLASLLKGEITLRSEPGRGSTFTLVLPSSVLTLSRPPAEPDADLRAARRRPGAILIAEDHPDSRQTLARVLRRMGYRVLEASNGRDALAMAATERLLAVLMDVNMPADGRDRGDPVAPRRRPHPRPADLRPDRRRDDRQPAAGSARPASTATWRSP